MLSAGLTQKIIEGMNSISSTIHFQVAYTTYKLERPNTKKKKKKPKN